MANKWSLLALIILFAIGCKKITEETGSVGVCPIVISTNPIDTSQGVGLNASINATFNEEMSGSSITSETFTIRDGGVLHQGTVTYSGSTATFTSNSAFVPGTLYTATITTGVRDPAGNAMLKDYVWTFNTGTGADVSAPTVISTNPAHLAVNVLPNKTVSILFSEAMDSALAVTSVTVQNTTAGGTAVAGTFTYSGSTLTFDPTSNLAANSTFTVTVNTTAKDLSATPLEDPYVFNFSTGVALETIPPTVISTDPVDQAVDVSMDKVLTATFSEPMKLSTINATTFTLKNGSTLVPGTVTYTGLTAKFSPTTNLFSNTTYTATITSSVRDTAGNAMLSNYVWTFTTVQPIVPPSLLTAAVFGSLGGSAGITNQGLNTVINNGSIGTTAVSTAVTGFHDGVTGDVYTETPLNKGNVSGGIFTAPPTPGNATTFDIATNALSDATDAYNSISPASKPGGTDPGAGELGSLTLPSGIYKAAGGSFKISNGDLTLDAKGDQNAVWIFQTASSLTVGIAGPTGARNVKLINGAQAKNVYWYVGSMATINGAGGGTMVGTIIASAGVTFSTAGNAVQTVLNGRALSLNASVTMVNTTINVP